MGRCHGATRHHDEIHRGVLQQGERTGTAACRPLGQRLPSRHRHHQQRKHRHLPRYHPKQHQHSFGSHRQRRQHHVVKQPAARAGREKSVRRRNETGLLQIRPHQDRPGLRHRAMAVLQRIAELHRTEGRVGRYDRPLHGGNHAQLGGRACHHHQRRPKQNPQLRQSRQPDDARHQLCAPATGHHARRERPATNRVHEHWQGHRVLPHLRFGGTDALLSYDPTVCIRAVPPHRLPAVQLRPPFRAKPGVGRHGQRDRSPTGHAYLVADGMDRAAEDAGRAFCRHTRDGERHRAPANRHRPLLEDRLCACARAYRHQLPHPRYNGLPAETVLQEVRV